MPTSSIESTICDIYIDGVWRSSNTILKDAEVARVTFSIDYANSFVVSSASISSIYADGWQAWEAGTYSLEGIASNDPNQKTTSMNEPSRRTPAITMTTDWSNYTFNLTPFFNGVVLSPGNFTSSWFVPIFL